MQVSALAAQKTKLPKPFFLNIVATHNDERAYGKHGMAYWIVNGVIELFAGVVLQPHLGTPQGQ